MNISYFTVENNLDVSRGYGAAGFSVVRSLQELGHTVPFDDPDCDKQIAFCQPTSARFHPGQKRIIYTPWESTELPDGWLRAFNLADEVWATSPWVANVYKNAGVEVPIFTYQHGLDKKWVPKERTVTDKVKFLHIGEPALRKGGQFALDAFRAVFGDRDDVHLTIKAYGQHWLRGWRDGDLLVPDHMYNNVSIIYDNLHSGEMVDLYNDHHVMVYPSYGEGFGLIPLQALGTGMPTICSVGWAPYSHFLGPLGLYGQWDRSIWSLHPGEVFYPNYDMLLWLYESSFNNIEKLLALYYKQASEVHRAYDWLTLTKDAFSHLEN
jgi:hypothetical protein